MNITPETLCLWGPAAGWQAGATESSEKESIQIQSDVKYEGGMFRLYWRSRFSKCVACKLNENIFSTIEFCAGPTFMYNNNVETINPYKMTEQIQMQHIPNRDQGRKYSSGV